MAQVGRQKINHQLPAKLKVEKNTISPFRRIGVMNLVHNLYYKRKKIVYYANCHCSNVKINIECCL